MRLLILFILLSFSATAQKAKPLTLKYTNGRIDSLVRENKALKAKLDTTSQHEHNQLIKRIITLEKKGDTLIASNIYVFVPTSDSVVIKKAQ